MTGMATRSRERAVSSPTDCSQFAFAHPTLLKMNRSRSSSSSFAFLVRFHHGVGLGMLTESSVLVG